MGCWSLDWAAFQDDPVANAFYQSLGVQPPAGRRVTPTVDARMTRSFDLAPDARSLHGHFSRDLPPLLHHSAYRLTVESTASTSSMSSGAPGSAWTGVPRYPCAVVAVTHASSRVGRRCCTAAGMRSCAGRLGALRRDSPNQRRAGRRFSWRDPVRT